jgi:hypothetical protein
MYKLGTAVQSIPLKEMRPTQLTVGFRKVKEKRDGWAAMTSKKRRVEMARQLFPVVEGPNGRLFILDHHHNARALLEEGVKEVQVGRVCDLSKLKNEEFWIYLDHRSWVHCYDERGTRVTFDKIPKRFEDMKDDPYRSVAASVEERGGFSKPDEPFFEFLWANQFRSLVPLSLVEANYDDAVSTALEVARSKKSRHLPGWAGPR